MHVPDDLAPSAEQVATACNEYYAADTRARQLAEQSARATARAEELRLQALDLGHRYDQHHNPARHLNAVPEPTPAALSEEQARAAYEAVCAMFAATWDETITPHPEPYLVQGDESPSWQRNGPVLVKNYDWATSGPWAIAWEGGPYDWPMYVPRGGRTEEAGFTMPKVELAPEIHVEAINGWAIGLYLDTPVQVAKVIEVPA